MRSCDTVVTVILLWALVCLQATTIQAAELSSAEADKLWQAWAAKYEKTYDLNSPNGLVRYAQWIERVQQAAEHNLRYEVGLETYRQGLNQFSDMTWEELGEIYFSQPPPNVVVEQTRGNIDENIQPVSVNLPESLDWSAKGWVAPVRDQGFFCGSCWAFATAAVLESQYYNQTGKLVEFSPQQFVDCSKENNNCRGGLASVALVYAQNKGVELESEYPYQGQYRACHYRTSQVAFTPSNHLAFYNTSEEFLKELVATHGPIAVGMQTTKSFFGYSGGIFSTTECQPYRVNHAVVVVGYGTDDGDKEFWLVKNCWGTGWGAKGYFKIARNRGNMCSIAMIPSVPIY